MVELCDLPTEVIREILSLCDPSNITETCRYFTSIAYSIPTLWSSIHLDHTQCHSPHGPNLLRMRLFRAKPLLLNVSIGSLERPSSSRMPPVSAVARLCEVLADFNMSIDQLQINAISPRFAAAIFTFIFPNSNSFPALRSLSFKVANDSHEGYDDFTCASLDTMLEIAADRFPGLEALRLPSFYTCVPLPSPFSSFGSLRSLLLDGSRERFITNVGLIVALLHNTPQLETLWVKHFSWYRIIDISNSTHFEKVKDRENIPLRVHLPRLTCLALSAPGSACDLLHCIEAPSLRDLHLDGSRGPVAVGTVARGYPMWSDEDVQSTDNALRHFSTRSPSLRRLAITSVYLGAECWQWLLFGSKEGLLPFPNLESVALRGLVYTPFQAFRTQCGFDDVLLNQLSRCPPGSRIPLRRLALLQCKLALCGSTVVQSLKTIMTEKLRNDNESYEFEFDTLLSQDEIDALVKAGVKLTQYLDREAETKEWWARDDHLDASDSHVY